jgi:GNAT superfamily N-acetyltransferase
MRDGTWLALGAAAALAVASGRPTGSRSVGKRVGGRLYLHRSALSTLSGADQARVRAAERRAGRPAWDLVRVGPDDVMLGRVPGLSRDPHPALAESWTVRGSVVRHRTYSGDSAPVYHRTELMLAADHPERARLAAQTAREEALGLLGRPDIGTVGAWRRVQGSVNRPPDSTCLTAMHRKGKASLPVRWLVEQGLVRGPVLDYGSGHGDDARWLRKRGFKVTAYDPCHGPTKAPTGRYQTVLATYVLNTVKPKQQAQILDRLRALLRPGGTAYITVRADVEGAGLTARGTYQRDVRLRFPEAGTPGSARIYRLDAKAGSRSSTRIHAMKTPPWTERLSAGTAELDRALRAGDRAAIVAGLDDVSFWIGRTMCDAIAGGEGVPQNERVFRKALAAVVKGREAIQRARVALSGRGSASSVAWDGFVNDLRGAMSRAGLRWAPWVDSSWHARFVGDVTFELTHDGGVVVLENLYVLPERRERGVATGLLRVLTGLADKHGLTLELTADPLDAEEQDYEDALFRLQTLYRRFGFQGVPGQTLTRSPNSRGPS